MTIRRTLFTLFLCLLGGCSACTPKFKPFYSTDARNRLDLQSKSVKTVRGKAWVSAESPQGSVSFPAVIALDRRSIDNPKLRIEARDPFGATHTLMILKNNELTWIDFNKQKKNFIQKKWQGLPLSKLPDLIVGIGRIPKTAKVGAAKEDSFMVEVNKRRVRHQMKWIDPGPRLALGAIDGSFAYVVNRGRHRIKDEYRVEYSKYGDKDEFYLPRRVDIESFRTVNGEQKSQQLELKIRWRQRAWNQAIEPAVFKLPNVKF